MSSEANAFRPMVKKQAIEMTRFISDLLYREKSCKQGAMVRSRFLFFPDEKREVSKRRAGSRGHFGRFIDLPIFFDTGAEIAESDLQCMMTDEHVVLSAFYSRRMILGI